MASFSKATDGKIRMGATVAGRARCKPGSTPAGGLIFAMKARLVRRGHTPEFAAGVWIASRPTAEVE
jgi:hypothetical protein